MRRFTLKVHQSNFSEESLVINAKDFPDVKRDDIVKIYSCDGDPANHLVMKVKSLKKEGELQKNAISVEQTHAHRFNLHAFQSVYVVKVDPMDISLDMVEVMFKEQYVSRSDMWRLKRHLVGSCTCVDEKVEFCDIRAQVNELWINGSRVKCGLVTDSTRIVLRSATALVYIFIQMSREMWDFDAYGQLQFEKAVDGFLRDLFTKWKEKSLHEFTLVIFSRSFYNASELGQFPDEVRHVVQEDYRGRLYIDFYYCVAHHERSEDCSPILFRLKKLFSDYNSLVHIPNCPPCTNSSASEGNFLEAINMSLNVFEKHYVDRNFDRTGQLVLCITPGVGVFDVDRDLTILTKERMIDNGIGSDLVCLGQQPLHNVPLFKFHHRSKDVLNKKEMPHSFNIPHWINHSFYSPNPFLDKGTIGIKHIPRVTFSLKKGKLDRKQSIQMFDQSEKSLRCDFPSLLTHNAEEFDNEIFGSPRDSYQHRNQSKLSPQSVTGARKNVRARIRTISDSLKQQPTFEHMLLSTTSSPLRIPKQFLSELSEERGAISLGPPSNFDKYFTKQGKESSGMLVGSAHSFHTPLSKKQHIPQRALINPFITSNAAMQPVTSNRRRWVHTHPIPQPSFRARQRLSERLSESSDICADDLGSDVELSVRNPSRQQSSQSVAGSSNSSEFSAHDNRFSGSAMKTALSTIPAVNWKSLRSPACLPITNDYFPSKLQLNNEYTEQSYNLIPDHEDGPFSQGSEYLLSAADVEQGSNFQASQQITTREVFLELVNQRLCQGFQLVVSDVPRHRTHYDSLTMSTGRISPVSLRKDTSFASLESTSPAYSQFSDYIASPESAESYTLNHGRQYHVVSLTGENTIMIKIYKPRHPFLTSMIEYKYLLWAVGRDRFRVANIKFAHELYEHYHWNYQDNCVCVAGADSDYQITESIKYWRAKFFVIPSPLNKLRQQKSEIETACKENRSPRYDIFTLQKASQDDICKIFEKMLRFFHNINKVRRIGLAVSQWHLPQKSEKASNDLSVSTSSLPSSAPSTPSQQVHKIQPPEPAVHSSSLEATAVENLGHTFDSHQGKKLESGAPECVGGSQAGVPKQKLAQDENLARKVTRAMLDKESGLSFLQHQGRLQNHSFLSADAVCWCLKKDFGLTGIEEVVSLFEEMRQQKYICHASWDFGHPFLYGYFIFHIVPEGVGFPENDFNKNFESGWLEVEMKFKKTPQAEVNTESLQKKKPKSALSRQLETVSTPRRRQYGLSKMKTVLIPLNNKHKTGRNEWCQVQHPASIMPLRGSTTFSFNVQWMVATATCLFEMLHSWLREATRCELCMIPSPNNPFAFPHTQKDASPLHCPLFVPLDLEKLSSRLTIFQELVAGETMECRKRIIDLMENIAQRFGFESYHVPVDHDAERNNTVNSRHFVHYTGQAFLEIPATRELKVQGRTVAIRQQYSHFTRKSADEPSKCKETCGNSVADGVSGSPLFGVDVSRLSDSVVNLKDCGFYFSVNHMLTKRWRLPAYDGCPISELEADFIEFCACDDDRLSALYKDIYS